MWSAFLGTTKRFSKNPTVDYQRLTKVDPLKKGEKKFLGPLSEHQMRNLG